MKVNWRHKIAGIYCIKNNISKKVYIGQSINIAKRIYGHKYSLNTKTSHCTRLQRAWTKYGEESFEYFVLESINKNIDNLIKVLDEREIYWQNQYDSIKHGYNLIEGDSRKRYHHKSTKKKFGNRSGTLNSNYGNKWSDEQKQHLSKLKKQMISDGIIKPLNREHCLKAIEVRNKKWKENPELIQKMVDKCNLTKIKYEIHQLTEEGILIKAWENMLELSKEHPEYKRHNIYAVCSGEKKRMYGYKWKKVLKSDYDIVQSHMKV